MVGEFYRLRDGKPTPRGDDQAAVTLNPPEQQVTAEDAIEPIVDPKLWARCQRRLAAIGGAKRKRGARERFPLTGLLFCGKCGRRMTGSSHRGRREYVCSSYEVFGPRGGCLHQTVDAAEVLDHLKRLDLDELAANLPGLAESLGEKVSAGFGVIEPGERPRHVEAAFAEHGGTLDLPGLGVSVAVQPKRNGAAGPLRQRIASDIAEAKKQATALEKKKTELDATVGRLAGLLKDCHSAELEREYKAAVAERADVAETLARESWTEDVNPAKAAKEMVAQLRGLVVKLREGSPEQVAEVARQLVSKIVCSWIATTTKTGKPRARLESVSYVWATPWGRLAGVLGYGAYAEA